LNTPNLLILSENMHSESVPVTRPLRPSRGSQVDA